MNRRQEKDIRLLSTFVEVYCSGKHHDIPRSVHVQPGHQLCQECADFLEYAIKKRLKCPLEAEKPTCKHCRIHCYDSQRRSKVREIMAYAGRTLLLRGRLDYLWHYFF